MNVNKNKLWIYYAVESKETQVVHAFSSDLFWDAAEKKTIPWDWAWRVSTLDSLS